MNVDNSRCNRCREIYRIYRTRSAETKLSCHISVITVYKDCQDQSHGDERKRKRTEICRKISALRNSRGGQLLVHINGLDDRDPFTGYFDEFIDDDLDKVILDGSLFTEVFYKTRITGDAIVVSVAPSSKLIIAEPRTKFTLDKGLKPDEPKYFRAYLIKRILEWKRRAQVGSVNRRQFYLRVRQTRQDIETILHEKRDIQVKTCFQQEVTENAQRLAHYIWNELKLPHYISAFAKLPEGGSFIVGVEELETHYRGYMSKKLQVNGLNVKREDGRDLHKHLVELVKSKLCICDFSGELIQNNDLIKTRFQPVGDEKYVIEIAVGSVQGMVFCCDGHEAGYLKGSVAYATEESGTIVSLSRKQVFDSLTTKG